MTTIVQTIIYKHRPLHKLVIITGHTFVLDVYWGRCLRYEPGEHGESVLEPVNVA